LPEAAHGATVCIVNGDAVEQGSHGVVVPGQELAQLGQEFQMPQFAGSDFAYNVIHLILCAEE